MNKIVKIVAITTLVLGLTACGVSSQVKSSNPLSSSSKEVVTGFSSFGIVDADIHYAVRETVNTFVSSPNSIKPGGGRWVVQYEEITNDTVIDLNTKILTNKIRNELTNSGRFLFTAATGTERTNTISEARDLQDSELFDQSTTASNGTVVAPDLSIFGAVRQQLSVSQDAQQQQSAYYFQFSVVDIASGLIIFSADTPITKEGSNQNYSWWSRNEVVRIIKKTEQRNG